jgi:lipopolysaccharide exporter
MSEKKYWLKSGFFTMMHRGTGFILGFLGFMLLVRIYEPVEFGIWVLFISIISIIEMGRNGFVQNGLIKFLGNQNEESKVQTAALVLNGALTLFLMTMLWLAAYRLENLLNAPGLGPLLRTYCFILPLLIFHTHNLVLMQAKYDFKAYFIAGIAKSLPFFLIILFCFYQSLSISLVDLAWYQNGTFVLAAIVSHIQVRKTLNFQWGWHFRQIKQLFHFGKFVFGTNLVSMLTGSLDKFLLGMLLSPVQVAIANTAGRVMNMIEIPVNSIASIAYPKASEAYELDNIKEVEIIFEKTVGMMLSITLPFFFVVVLLAEEIIQVIAGNEYIAAAPFLRIISLMAILSPFDRQSGVILDALGKPAINMVMVMGTFTYGLGFTWFFINGFGLYGAAFGPVAAVFVTVVIKQIVLKRYIVVRYWQPFVQSILFYPVLFRMLLEMIKKQR